MFKFTGSYEDLARKLASIPGEWDEAQKNKKVFRAQSGIMNWYETTGTISFQGKEDGRAWLESKVSELLNYTVSHDSTVSSSPADEDAVVDDSTFSIERQYLTSGVKEGELIIGIVSSVGTESKIVVDSLSDRLKSFGYNVVEVRVSYILPPPHDNPSEYERIRYYMELGDSLRECSGNNAILAAGVIDKISKSRAANKTKNAYIINSLKHPGEVELLRKVYGLGFSLIGIHADAKRRHRYLTEDKGCTTEQAEELIVIDENENIEHGQKTRDTYHLADFFLSVGRNYDSVRNRIQRFLELMFSHPYRNPTFDEYAMFMAFNNSAVSGDLSRQVGAVITKEEQIIAAGANDVPKSGGGLYWAEVDIESGKITDIPDGKDYTRGVDSNKEAQREIIDSIKSKLLANGVVVSGKEVVLNKVLRESQVSDLIEFGRIVHAEMDALISCAREGFSTKGNTLYCTTFPCHNCAKHIIASGIKRVVYVEPYPKSRAFEFHSESIELKVDFDRESESSDGMVTFEPFIGVGPRRFLDLFSMTLGRGAKIKRKDKDGKVLNWEIPSSGIRTPLIPSSYLEVEKAAIEIWREYEPDLIA
ncbi:cytidine deaminase [Halomonas sp. SF2003]|nr:cytidine deaminase [Halomonas sp. SF2003]